MVIEHAYAEGLQVIARLDYVPDWARPKDTTARYLDPTRYADFGDYRLCLRGPLQGPGALLRHLERAQHGRRVGLPAR